MTTKRTLFVQPSAGKTGERYKDSNSTVLEEVDAEARQNKQKMANDSMTRDWSKARPLQVIRGRCADCCGWEMNEVKLCECRTCPNWPWRFGKRPATAAGAKRQMSEKQKANMDRLVAANAKKREAKR